MAIIFLQDSGSPGKESLASRLQRKTISFLPTREDSSSDKVPVKSLLEIRREKRLQQKQVEEKPSSDGSAAGVAVKSLAEIRRERRLQQKEDGDDDEEDKPFDPNKIKVKSLSEIRKEKRTVTVDRTSGPSAIVIKSLADIRREKQKQNETEESTQNVESESVTPSTIQQPDVKKSPSAGQKRKGLTDAERRERRAKIWRRELRQDDPPVSSSPVKVGSNIGAVGAVKSTADSSLFGLKVKTLDEIRKEKGKSLEGRDEEGKDREEETSKPGKKNNQTINTTSN